VVSVHSSCSIEAGFESRVISVYDFSTRGSDIWLAYMLYVQKKQI